MPHEGKEREMESNENIESGDNALHGNLLEPILCLMSERPWPFNHHMDSLKLGTSCIIIFNVQCFHVLWSLFHLLVNRLK